MIGTAALGPIVENSSVGSAVHVGMSNVPKNNNVSVIGKVEHCLSDSCGAGSVLEPNLVCSPEQTKGGITDEVLMTTREGLSNIGLQDSMGIASSPRKNGKTPLFSWASLNTANSTFSLSLIECSCENMSAQPTMEEVIAFGGIPKASLGVRTSNRLGCQPGVDMPQMEKAMRNAQLRNAPSSTSKSLPPKFSIINVPDSEIIHRRIV
jgi:hypothetical protein